MDIINSIWGIVATAMIVGSLGYLVETTRFLGEKALDAHQNGGLVSLPELNKMLFSESRDQALQKTPKPAKKVEKDQHGR